MPSEANIFTQSADGFKVHFKIVVPEGGPSAVADLIGSVSEMLSLLRIETETEGAFVPDASMAGPAGGFRRGGGQPRQTTRQNRPQQRQARPQRSAVACGFCNGPTWDNNAQPGGKRNPKQPDYKCKDPSCGGAAWFGEDGELGEWQ